MAAGDERKEGNIESGARRSYNIGMGNMVSTLAPEGVRVSHGVVVANRLYSISLRTTRR